jgi:hypothetical protein
VAFVICKCLPVDGPNYKIGIVLNTAAVHFVFLTNVPRRMGIFKEAEGKGKSSSKKSRYAKVVGTCIKDPKYR